MKRSRRVVALLIAATIIALAIPAVSWRLYAWSWGEPVWKGRPARYWAGRFSKWQFTIIAGDRGFSGSREGPVPAPTRPPMVWMFRKPGPEAFWGRTEQWLAFRTKLPCFDGFAANLGQLDPVAVPVLLELLKNSNPTARAFAASALTEVGAWFPETRSVVAAALQGGLSDREEAADCNFSVADVAREGLRAIENIGPGRPRTPFYRAPPRPNY